MKYFIDTEFIEDFTRPLIGKPRHYIDMISIGIIAEDGREYYAISNEFDIDYVWNKFQWKESPLVSLNTGTGTKEKEYWLRENVLMPIFYEWSLTEWNVPNEFAISLASFKADHVWRNDLWMFKKLIKKYGQSNTQIAKEIERFVRDGYKKASSDPIEFYGYYADYDWVLFCSLYGRMLDLPKELPMYCRDLKQILDEKAETLSPLSFDANLMMIKQKPAYPKQSNAHNALDDARWNKKLYDFLKTV